MNIPIAQNTENGITSLLLKNPKLEILASNICNTTGQNKIQICDFLFFCIANDLFIGSNTSVLILVFLRCAFDVGFNNYIIDLCSFILSTNDDLMKYSILAFLNDPKLTNYVNVEIDGIKPLLLKTYHQKSSDEISKAIIAEIQKLSKTGPEIPFSGVYVFKNDTYPEPLFEDYSEINNILNDLKTLGLSDNLNSRPDILIPIPAELPTEIDEFLTPFPFIVESPLLNPNLPYSQIANEMIKNCAKLNANEIKAK